jgi:endonuclease/exonuclease/phosphatase family metal-dependent hydrolase
MSTGDDKRDSDHAVQRDSFRAPVVDQVFRVATVNVLNDLSRWSERLPLLVGGLSGVSPDLIALQEVTDPLGTGTAYQLAGELGGYSVWVCPKSGPWRRREGIAVLSRLSVEEHEVLDLGSQGRTAQLVRVRVGGRPLVVVNGHFYWPPGVHSARVRQVGRLTERIRAFDEGAPVVICGDFNATPSSPAIDLMRYLFVSAHEAVHGREPAFTCPTPLVNGSRVRSALTRGLLRLFTNRPDLPWQGTLDYIFVSPGLRVLGCEAFLDRPSPDDPTLFASDHLGLWAKIEVPEAMSEGLPKPPDRPSGLG